MELISVWKKMKVDHLKTMHNTKMSKYIADTCVSVAPVSSTTCSVSCPVSFRRRVPALEPLLQVSGRGLRRDGSHHGVQQGAPEQSEHPAAAAGSAGNSRPSAAVTGGTGQLPVDVSGNPHPVSSGGAHVNLDTSVHLKDNSNIFTPTPVSLCNGTVAAGACAVSGYHMCV